jgi:RNA polymerase sigma factor (sigma-70 family)
LRSSAPLRAHESVSDLVQSTCREALRHADRLEYRGDASFREWLATVALNKLRERERFLRAAKRDLRREQATADGDAQLSACYADLAGASPSQHAIASERVAQLERAFDQLSGDQREVLLAARLLGLSHAEIAGRLGKSEVAVRSLLSRALVRISALLEREDPRE